MKKIDYRNQALDLVDRLLSIVESGGSCQAAGRVTEPATEGQLRLLNRLGIRPRWIATRQEAEEMIIHYKAILNSAK